MSARWINNFCAVCIVILVLAMIIVLGGCGMVSVDKEADGSYEARSWSVLKDVKDVNIDKGADGEVTASLGSSTSRDAEAALLLVCTINPALPQCQKSQ